jgi:hypothetical protein|tara:strand:- start:8 stop:625 length:618 start_codon:yes stop_codon:yes gene_type:complete
MNEKEERIKEQRTIEAAHKNLSGLGGKFGIILQGLGQPIMAQGGDSLYDSWNIEDPFEIIEKKELGGTPEEMQGQIPYFNSNTGEEPVGGSWRNDREYVKEPYSVYKIGYIFDGLSKGIHVEIKYILDNNELTVYHKGYLVYKEVAGDLLAYAPNDEWEEKVDRLFQSAKNIRTKKSKESQKEKVANAMRKRDSWWQTIKAKWGL